MSSSYKGNAELTQSALSINHLSDTKSKELKATKKNRLEFRIFFEKCTIAHYIPYSELSKIPSFRHLLFYKAYCEPKGLPVYSVASRIIETKQIAVTDRIRIARPHERIKWRGKEMKGEWKGGGGCRIERLEDYLIECSNSEINRVLSVPVLDRPGCTALLAEMCACVYSSCTEANPGLAQWIHACGRPRLQVHIPFISFSALLLTSYSDIYVVARCKLSTG